MRTQFKDTVLDLASKDASIVLLFGDVDVFMFSDFKAKFPSRFYNIGICENTIVSMGAGLSAQGFIPFMHSIAPFITERSFEQIKIDMCYNKFGGNIVSCGASFDYAWDGATQHAFTDLAILRLLPGMEVVQPGSRRELDLLMRSQYKNGNPTYYRLSDDPHDIEMPVTFGEAVILKDAGAALTVMTAGPILGNVMEACRDLHVNLVYFHTIKPIDKKAIDRYKTTEILVVHDAFGLCEAIAEVPGVRLSYHGLSDGFSCSYGTPEDVRKKIGLDAASIRDSVRKRIK